MAIVLKCKMCGGNLDVNEGEKVCECEYCGTTQTVPDADNDKKINLFNRANRLRTASEFDKAASVYENIVSEFPEEAEAYWGLCLCKYGIEYVDDPATGKKIPTCHRTSFESIFDDSNFDMALEYSDVIAQRVYREEAKEIDRLQKAILDIAGKEEPFDVFICYKETAEDGQRTKDSVMAQDIYDALTDKGYKVFFARITLEDKLGQEYEPYIFSALTSAKVMLAIGTDYEYFNAVWVKNEWSRFLDMMKSDKSKTLIPCYADIDAYDMPQEFRNLQGQDMSKVGFIQDLVRGIGKIIPKDEPKTVTIERIVENGNANTASLLKRAFMFLEDSNWSSADEYAEKVLDIDPENAEAYLVKLMAMMKANIKENLKNCAETFDSNNLYRKICKFGNDVLINELSGYNQYISERNEEARKENIYSDACKKLAESKSEAELKNIENAFKSIIDYKDSAEKISECEICIDIARKEEIYCKACNILSENQNYKGLQEAKKIFESIIDYKDSSKKAKKCEELCLHEQQLKQALPEMIEINLEIQELEKKLSDNLLRAGITKEELCNTSVSDVQTKISDVRSTINKLTSELNSLGFLSFGRKKEIQREINLLESKIWDYKAEIQAFEIRTKINEYKQNRKKYSNVIYTEARKYYDTLPIKSYLLFNLTKDYKDSKRYLANLSNLFAVGKKIHLGNYNWLILKREQDMVLLIADEIIETKKYNEQYVDVTWENCSLRQYLNDEFLNNFSDLEKGAIAYVMNFNMNNSYLFYDTPGGKATFDKVFLLSIEEAEPYLSSENDILATYNYNTYWWLRSPGGNQSRAASVNKSTIDYGGCNVNLNFGVRPALYLKI